MVSDLNVVLPVSANLRVRTGFRNGTASIVQMNDRPPHRPDVGMRQRNRFNGAIVVPIL